ncbi:MAG: glycosyltransferase [Thermoleophilaceae bacterium]
MSRFLVASFGDPGHAFPVIALGRELAARGHEVRLQTWVKWREHVEREGMRFEPAPEYHVFPTPETRGLKPYQAAVRAARETQPLIAEFAPDAIVADILTVAAGLAAELSGRPWASLVPHVLPTPESGFPPYSMGARLPRTRAGAALWRTLDPLLMAGLRRGRDELNGARERLGLPSIEDLHGGLSRRLTIVATFPQLEYPRRWEPWQRVVGPLMWEQPYGEVELPPGDDPLVLVAPSTSQDPAQKMLRASIEGLANERVRVLATFNRRPPPQPIEMPRNARLVEWVSYAKTMPRCDVVVCHAGHGTVARSLASGVPVVACPAAGDMAENAARIAWAGVGVGLPRRLVTARGVRLAVKRVVGDVHLRGRARRLGEWSEQHDGAAIAADLLEDFAETPQPARGGLR